MVDIVSQITNVDFSEMAVRIAYGLAGVSIPEELVRNGGPYAVPGFEKSRPAVKKMLNAMFFASNLDQWTTYTDDVQDDLHSGRYVLYHQDEVVPVQEMIERIMQEHLPIFDSFNRAPCIGHRLQNSESDIIVGSMLTLIRKHQVVSLPTHDCLWVAVGDVGIAQKVMLDTFKQTVGAEGKVVINDDLPIPSTDVEAL